MQTITKYLALVVLCLNVQLINAQDTIQNVNNKHKIEDTFNELAKYSDFHFKSEEKITENDETAIRFDVDMDQPFNVDWLAKLKA